MERLQHDRGLKTKIDLALIKGQRSPESFKSELQKQGIHVAVRENAQGIILWALLV